MTEPEIFARLTALHSALVAKLEAQPFLEPSVTVYSGGKCKITIWSAYNNGDYKSLHVSRAETIAECLAGAEAFVRAMPGADVLARSNWHRKLGTVIDEGHALALPDDVMSPLRQGSQAMTENLLTVSATA
jgi:hypothetical protein